jgi:tellurite methyltransferase
VKSDREKWEDRYGSAEARPNDPDPFLVQRLHLLGSGRSLDLAAGRGANALFLAEHGFQVDAVDISHTALRVLQSAARQRRADVACVVADLDHFPLPQSVYDLVAVFYFFAKPLILPIKAALKPGGTLCHATYNLHHTGVKPGFNPAYLIEPNDLALHFAEFQTIVHEPESGESGNVSRLIARRPWDDL